MPHAPKSTAPIAFEGEPPMLLRHPPQNSGTVTILSRACRDMPDAVVCLVTAAHLQGLLPDPRQSPWVAIQQGSNEPRAYEAWQIIRWSKPNAFLEGVIDDDALGAPLRRTSPARTVVDLIRYSRRFRGIGIGAQAAHRYVAAGRDPADLLTVARKVSLTNEAARYLDAIVCTLQAVHR